MAIPAIAPYALPDEAALPPGRVAWTLEPDRAVLLIHDMQRYFLDAFQDGASPVSELIPNIAQLRRRCGEVGVPVVFTAQPGGQRREQRGLLQDFWGAGLRPGRDEEIVEALAPAEGDLLITKWRYSGLVRTDLLDRMAALGRDQLVITGIYAHIGCLMTAAHAFMEDVQPFLVADAIADFSLEDHRMALDYAARRCALPTTVGRALSELERTPAGVS
jgi:bifunctional isochorismate lyase / aryl carrier protein